MNDSVRMRKRNGIAHFLKDTQQVRERLCINCFVEPPSVHKFHCIKHTAILESTYIVYGNYAWVLQQRNDLSFSHHSRCKRTRWVIDVHDFHSYLAAELRVLREVNRSHPARPQLSNNHVFRIAKIGKIRL